MKGENQKTDMLNTANDQLIFMRTIRNATIT